VTTTTTIRAVHFPYFFSCSIYAYDPCNTTSTPPCHPLSSVGSFGGDRHTAKKNVAVYTLYAFEYTYINTKIRVEGCSGGASFLPIHFIPFLRRAPVEINARSKKPFPTAVASFPLINQWCNQRFSTPTTTTLTNSGRDGRLEFDRSICVQSVCTHWHLLKS